MQQASCSHVANLHDAADADENEVEEEEELIIAVDKRRMIELRNLGVPQRKIDGVQIGVRGVYTPSRPLIVDPTLRKRIPVRLLNEELTCPICLSIVRKCQTFKTCLHRFCAECIQKYLRLGQKECPQCRVKVPSRRALQPDPAFDKMVATFYPDSDLFEEKEEECIVRINQDSHFVAAAIQEGMLRQSTAIAEAEAIAGAGSAASRKRAARGRTKIVKTLGWQGQPQERNPGRICGKLAAVVVPGDEKTREQETMAGGHGSDHTHRLPSAKPSSQETNASDPQIALAYSHEAGSSQSAITENCRRQDEQTAGGFSDASPTRLNSGKANVQEGQEASKGATRTRKRQWNQRGDTKLPLVSHEVGSSQKSESTHQSTKDCLGTDAQTTDLHALQSGSDIEIAHRVDDYLISPTSGPEVERYQPALKKRKSDDTPRTNASKAETNIPGSMKRKHDVTQGAKADSSVSLDLGTTESGARDNDALKQVWQCDEILLTQLLTSYGLATDGSHKQRVNRFYDAWSQTKSTCEKTAPEAQTDGSDNDHKADSAHPSFLDALPSLQLSTLLHSLGMPGNGNRRVLEDRLIECYKQEHGLTSDLDHSTSDEEALDASEEGGTSTKISAEASNISAAKPPLRIGQGRSANTMRKQRSANPVVPPAGTKRSAWVRSLQLQIYREITNSKKTVRPESIARAVKKVFESNNADLAANEREHRDLSDRLQQLNYERIRIFNSAFNFCIKDDWLDDMPHMFSVKLGGLSNKMEFVGGRNSDALNQTCESYRQLGAASGGNAIRAFIDKICQVAKGPVQKYALDENVTVQHSVQQLVKSMLKLSSEGVRSGTGCLLIQPQGNKSDGSLHDLGERNEGHATKNKNKNIEVQILFTHLLAWAQLRMLQSRPELAQFVKPSWLSNNSGIPIPIRTIWRAFNFEFSMQSPDLWASLRFHMRSLLFTCMPQSVFKDEGSKIRKPADLQIFALKHLHTKQDISADIPDPFLQSSMIFDQYRQRKGVTSTSETSDSTIKKRAEGKAFPGDLSKDQRKVAAVSMGFVYAKKKVFYPTMTKTTVAARENAQSFLNVFKPALQEGRLITEILPDHEMPAELKGLHDYKFNAEYVDPDELCDGFDLKLDQFIPWFECRLNAIYDDLHNSNHACTDPLCQFTSSNGESGHDHDFRGRKLWWWKDFLDELRRVNAVSNMAESPGTAENLSKSGAQGGHANPVSSPVEGVVPNLPRAQAESKTASSTVSTNDPRASQQKQAESKRRSGKIKVKVEKQDNDLTDALEGEVFDDLRQVEPLRKSPRKASVKGSQGDDFNNSPSLVI